MQMSLSTILGLVLLPAGASAVTYTHSNGVDTFDIATCPDGPRGAPTGTAAQIECSLNEAVLLPWQYIIDSCIDHAQSLTYCCAHQYDVCHSISEYQDNTPECAAHFSGCKQALRHMHKMMFNQSPLETEPQICNNFARKSIRGFFHDFMSNGIDGSILSEHHLSMNFGLCRWAQYVNVLSDETQCDPGSIIAISGMLGYQACGVPIWEQDVAVKPTVKLGRPYTCGEHVDLMMFDEATGQRKDQFSDTQAATNSTAMEEFWYTTNHHFARGDGEIEYSAEASAAAHAIGRVTCQPDGTDTEGNHIDFSLGFFHKKRDITKTTEREFYQEALDKIRETQCDESSGTPRPTDGVRTESARFPIEAGETNMNPEGGFCGMPTQFLGTVNVGGQHRVPRWIKNTEHMLDNRETGITPTLEQNERQQCKEQLQMYIPYEILTIDGVDLPESEALQKFVDIAWDGYDRIDSEWDGCEIGCDIPILENQFCGGSGLSSYDWTLGYCNSGVSNGHICCAASCGGVCDDAADCDERDGGSAACCMASIEAAGRECRSSWDVGCLIPRQGDGGVCTANDDCSSSSCKAGRCCNAYGQGEGAVACDLSGNAITCADGFVLRSVQCIDECECSAGCLDCACGTCSSCSDEYFLADGSCVPKVTAGQDCTADEECTSGRCTGGNCCDVDRIAAGCVDCNFRGLCDECADGYTLCGHTADGNGQCVESWNPTTTTFTCGTGGVDSDHPSSDGYNYCAQGQVCPCTDAAGCYKTCEISYDCWDAAFDYIEYVGDTMFRRGDPWVGAEFLAYEPEEFANIDPPVASNCTGGWGEWSECTEVCGGGTRTRSYEVTAEAQFGGTPCPAPTSEDCNTEDCPLDCTGGWGEWSECTEVCGGGTRTRSYEVTAEAQFGGTPCPAPTSEDCNTEECEPADPDDDLEDGSDEEESTVVDVAEVIEVEPVVLSADDLVTTAASVADALSGEAGTTATDTAAVSVRSSIVFPVALEAIPEGSTERSQFEQDFKAAIAGSLGNGAAVQPEDIIITAITAARRRMEAVDCPHMRMMGLTRHVANPHRQLQTGAVTVAFELITPSSVMQEVVDLFATMQHSNTPIEIEVGDVTLLAVPSDAMAAPTVVLVVDPTPEKTSGSGAGNSCQLLLIAIFILAVERGAQ